MTSRTLGRRPKPNQSTMSGASATMGTVWLATSRGIMPRRSQSAKWSVTETAKANRDRQAEPHTCHTDGGERVAGNVGPFDPEAVRHVARRRQDQRRRARDGHVDLPARNKEDRQHHGWIDISQIQHET